MKKSLIRKYARLIAVVGVNIQRKQPVLIRAAVDQYDFVTILTDECYKAGASEVNVEWRWQPITKLHFRHQSLKNLGRVLPWEEEKLRHMTKTLPARISIISEDPAGLSGINQDKMQKASQLRWPVIKPYSQFVENKTQWTVVAVPSKPWAKKVFPDMTASAAFEKLWNVILDCVHVNADNDPVSEWEAHNKAFEARCKWLNDLHLDKLVYKSSNGTDFTTWLMPESKWCGGSDSTINGVVFNANMPTEEIYTTPMKDKADGKLVSTKPLSYNGQMIDKFSIIFENGKAVKWQAHTGEDVLTRIIEMDEGSCMLGEVALIPCSSPINQSGILFYETLFDENASCHVALGAGYKECVNGYQNLTDEQCYDLGVNESMLHVDFMIGAEDMTITGYSGDTEVEVFKNGQWAINL